LWVGPKGGRGSARR